ncbi:MAG: dihydroorotase [Candidatus Omnitrophota bacterium]
MQKILIKNGKVIDPAQNINGETLDILVQSGKIAKLAKNIKADADKVIDASGKIVMPGIVDMHVHLREPGREDKETVASATAAALKGGVTSVLAMPNTQPAMDTKESLILLKKIVRASGLCNVFICAAITKERQGKELTDIPGLNKSGAIAISDDGASVDDENLFLAAMKKAKAAGIPVICHSEDKKLSGNGVVNRGIISTKLGLRGISRESEYTRVERDIKLAEKAKATIHIAHVSCRESVELIKQAKKRGVRVTAETAPHYFSLDQDALAGYDTNLKMNPPLREAADVEAIKQGLKSGVIDAIASDHAPHTENEKDIEFDRAEFGVIGLETELAAGITELVQKGVLDWPGLVKKFCLNPAKILGIDRGTLQIGKPADIMVVSPKDEWIVQKHGLASKSKNSAFIGKKLTGVAEYTVCNGNIAYQRL